MAGVAACDPGARKTRDLADHGEEVQDEPEDARPAVVHAKLTADEVVDERRERPLHGVGELLVGGELLVERHVAEAACDDPPVLGLMPVVETVAAVVRHLEEALRESGSVAITCPRVGTIRPSRSPRSPLG